MGEISWNEKVPVQIVNGRTKIRILEKPEVFTIHWIHKNEAFNKYKCSGKGCSFCSSEIKKTPRYYIEAFDYGDRIVKKFEIGYAVYQQIAGYIKDPSFGDPTRYDITIRKRHNVRGGSCYDVYVETPAPLSVENQNIVDELYGQKIPISKLILDGDDCPRCQVRGILSDAGFQCYCPECSYVIWERSMAEWIG